MRGEVFLAALGLLGLAGCEFRREETTSTPSGEIEQVIEVRIGDRPGPQGAANAEAGRGHTEMAVTLETPATAPQTPAGDAAPGAK